MLSQHQCVNTKRVRESCALPLFVGKLPKLYKFREKHIFWTSFLQFMTPAWQVISFVPHV